MYSGSQSPGTYGSMGWPMPAYFGCPPGAWVYVPAGSSPPASPQVVPQELSADKNTTDEGFVGGRSPVHLTLECRVDGPPLGQVELTIDAQGASSTLTYTELGTGYHIKDDFISVEPGSKLTIKTTDASARLRWCETICC